MKPGGILLHEFHIFVSHTQIIFSYFCAPFTSNPGDVTAYW